ncbi:MAG: hypothetical protein QME35_02420 [Thermoanaerobacteraceae bacterium]|nr:hypothetical protein [Thermoanaerobacteraceae bacterium]
MSEPLFTGKYFVAYAEELAEKKPLLGFVHPSFRFPHKGEIIVSKEGLILTNLGEIKFNELLKISLHYDSLYNRFWAGGIVGQYPRLAFLCRGEPLVLEFTKNGTKKRLYLLINWRFFTGFTDNRLVYKIMTQFLNPEVL